MHSKPDKGRRTERVLLNLTKDEYEKLVQVADMRGEFVGTTARQLLAEKLEDSA